jgi:uncharacterized membrane protein
MIMMSQNRQTARDRLEAHNDYLINLRAEEEIRQIPETLAVQGQALQQLSTELQALRQQLAGCEGGARRKDRN